VEEGGDARDHCEKDHTKIGTGHQYSAPKSPRNKEGSIWMKGFRIKGISGRGGKKVNNKEKRGFQMGAGRKFKVKGKKGPTEQSTSGGRRVEKERSRQAEVGEKGHLAEWEDVGSFETSDLKTKEKEGRKTQVRRNKKEKGAAGGKENLSVWV